MLTFQFKFNAILTILEKKQISRDVFVYLYNKYLWQIDTALCRQKSTGFVTRLCTRWHLCKWSSCRSWPSNHAVYHWRMLVQHGSRYRRQRHFSWWYNSLTSVTADYYRELKKKFNRICTRYNFIVPNFQSYSHFVCRGNTLWAPTAWPPTARPPTVWPPTVWPPILWSPTAWPPI